MELQLNYRQEVTNEKHIISGDNYDPKYNQLALMVIGNLAPCGKAQKQAVIDEGFILILIDLMKNKFDI
ncbi:hypothetical protein RYX36_003489, partial [Vicia faba]